MKKQVVVISLGGSLIIPDEINLNYLQSFKRVILKNTKKYKFIIVCGGGSIARKYISALKKAGLNEEFQSFSGISATRMNARFLNYLFRINPVYGIPHTQKTLKRYVRKQDVVFCGALEYKPHQTSDSSAAQLARLFHAVFINLTNVKGLHDKNPKKYKDAKFIPEISWKDFDKMANASKYQPGQHFVLDQTASKIILEGKVPTYIIGSSVHQLDNLLNNRRFIGTKIEG